MKLNATPRERLGRRSRSLLKEGLLPAVVYGRHSDSKPISLDAREFDRVFREAGRTHLVDLGGLGGRGVTKVLIKAVQTHPRHLGPIHVDLQAVSMREKLQVEVPVVAIGESPAVKTGLGEVMLVTHGLKVECLPGNIPEAFELDLSGLDSIGDQIRVGDLPPKDGVTILADAEEVLVKIQAPRVAAEEEEAEEAAAVEAAEEAAEAETPVSGEPESGPAGEAESGAQDQG
jgi:large subunit ribosomal protein L25